MDYSAQLHIARVRQARTRSISAENPTGGKGMGAQAAPGDDPCCTDAASDLGRGWKVRPCLRHLEPGQTAVLADIEGPGVVQHIWCTVLADVHRFLSWEVRYDGAPEPSIRTPLGDFFANGIDGRALVASQPIAVNPKGGMNSYWPMPFRRRFTLTIRNDGPKTIPEFFYQVTYSLEDLPEDAGYLHASWSRTLTSRDRPEHLILDRVRGRGHFAGTYLVWNQLSNGWWGEGEVKFFIDGDADDAPTICGTGTEDYFGGAWGFVMDHERDMRPTTYTTPYLGYPQAVYDSTAKLGPRIPSHGLYRWHIPDPVRFERDLRVSIQTLGWWPNGKFQPLTDDLASTAFYYVDAPVAAAVLPRVEQRFAR
ncbi:MAG TPA: glycoside hydrolase family 172 protein [Phycisphaerales bacterium]|nr:glycoside hydrolase family 172 protein [Phycisphaerales bacterium]